MTDTDTSPAAGPAVSGPPTILTCVICGHLSAPPQPAEIGQVRGNTARFRDRLFTLWKCPRCLSIHSIDPVDLRDIYRDYPLNRRRLDTFARGTLSHLLKRLARGGLERPHRILDFGCGNGVFVTFLRERGYRDTVGYDPYIDEFATLPEGRFDCVVANDVIEHVTDPPAMVRECADLVRPGGLLYIGTADSEPVQMNDLEPQIMRLHQPFHRVMITAASLTNLALESGLKLVQAYRRSYMDTLRPFSNYRFLDEFNKALGHDMDRAFAPDAGRILAKKPSLFFYAVFGYALPSAYEPAVLMRKPP